jgi:hypothetical protein
MASMTTRTASAVAVAALAALAALALAACGGGGGTSGKSDREKFMEAALKQAECMRRHGVDVPDPKPNGGIVFNGDVGNPEQLQRAQRACDKEVGKLPEPKMSAKDEREFREAALKHARCMRAHGIDFPDPKFGANGTAQIKIEPGMGPDDPAFRAADEKCRKLLGGPGTMLAAPPE